MAAKTPKLINAARGEAAFVVGGETHVVALTLGAMAAIETALEIDSFDQIGAALERPSATKLAAIVSALVCGGGGNVSVEEVKNWPLTVPEITDLIRAVVGGGAARQESSPGK